MNPTMPAELCAKLFPILQGEPPGEIREFWRRTLDTITTENLEIPADIQRAIVTATIDLVQLPLREWVTDNDLDEAMQGLLFQALSLTSCATVFSVFEFVLRVAVTQHGIPEDTALSILRSAICNVAAETYQIREGMEREGQPTH